MVEKVGFELRTKMRVRGLEESRIRGKMGSIDNHIKHKEKGTRHNDAIG